MEEGTDGIGWAAKCDDTNEAFLGGRRRKDCNYLGVGNGIGLFLERHE